jgi:hypothetical protein
MASAIGMMSARARALTTANACEPGLSPNSRCRSSESAKLDDLICPAIFNRPARRRLFRLPLNFVSNNRRFIRAHDDADLKKFKKVFERIVAAAGSVLGQEAPDPELRHPWTVSYANNHGYCGISEFLDAAAHGRPFDCLLASANKLYTLARLKCMASATSLIELRA